MEGSIDVLPDAEALARAAADRVVRRLHNVEGPVAVALTGGRSPERLYQLLATEPWRSLIPWDAVHWFWGDERFVPADDARSNARMAIDLLLDRVPVARDRIHRIPTAVATPHESARLYEEMLRHFLGRPTLDGPEPLFALVLMGLGDDGHTASLFPGQPTLEEQSHWVVGVDEAGMEPFVPRVTLTFPALASTREMLFIVSGAGKRSALERIQRGEMLPAARARSRGELVWLLDRDAAPEGLNTA
jgi:6-phosphogluconolactonase